MTYAINEFTISKTFNCPKTLLYKAWTDPALLKKWWGPKGFEVTYCQLDLIENGSFLYCLKSAIGMQMWGKFTFKEVLQDKKLVFINSFSDQDGNVTRHPFVANWPLNLLSTISFSEENGQAKLVVSWTPYNSTEIEIKTFNENHPSMQQGWGGTLEQLEEFLKIR